MPSQKSILGVKIPAIHGSTSRRQTQLEDRLSMCEQRLEVALRQVQTLEEGLRLTLGWLESATKQSASQPTEEI